MSVQTTGIPLRRRALARFAAFTTVVVALAGAPATAPAEAAATPTTTKSYTSEANIPIGGSYEEAGITQKTIIESNGPLASRYPWFAEGITGLAGTVTDVKVHLYGFTHERPTDVDILLTDGSHGVVLASDVGGGAPINKVNLTFDDAAPNTLSATSAFGSGTYRPTDKDPGDNFPGWTNSVGHALSDYDGSTYGNSGWGLYVVDDTFDHFGSIDGWSIEVTTTGVTPYPAPITVNGGPTKITDVDVTLHGLTHGRPSDVDVLLVGPRGQQATVLSDRDGAEPAVSNLDLVLDDEGAPPYRPLSDGRVSPSNAGANDGFPAPAPPQTGTPYLSTFDGTNANGTWRLFVIDDDERVRGEIFGWSLKLTGEGVDAVGPRVVTASPRALARRVARKPVLSARLSENVRPATVNRSTVYLVRAGTTRRVPARVTWVPSTRTIRLQPARKLGVRKQYRMVVGTGIQDLAGNRLDQDRTPKGLQAATWTFRTR